MFSQSTENLPFQLSGKIIITELDKLSLLTGDFRLLKPNILFVGLFLQKKIQQLAVSTENLTHIYAAYSS